MKILVTFIKSFLWGRVYLKLENFKCSFFYFRLNVIMNQVQLNEKEFFKIFIVLDRNKRLKINNIIDILASTVKTSPLKRPCPTADHPETSRKLHSCGDQKHQRKVMTYFVSLEYFLKA